MVDRLSTAVFFDRAIVNITEGQADLAKLQRQISSGQEAATYSELGPDTNRVLDLETSIIATDRFVQANEIVIGRIQAMDIAVSQMEEVARELASQLALERSPAGATFDLTEFAKSAMRQVADSMNADQAGRFLFSGSKTNTKPVDIDDLLLNTNIINSVVTSSYYKGDDLTFSVKASSELEVSYGIKGNDIAFQNLIGAINKAIEGDKGGVGADKALEDAFTFLNKAVDELARVRNQLNTDLVLLRGVNEQHVRVENQLKGLLDEAIGTDIVEASILVSQNEAILTATMQTFARISRLTLTQFLQ